MNNKKIVGNGGKATLPNGQKLSDKIQENKTKQSVENKKGRGTNSTSTNGNQSNKKGENTKSKGQQNAQAAGTEAAREALKKAAGTIPWTKWIPKGIRDKIIDKFMDSESGQAAVEKAMKKVKNTIMMIIAGAIASIVMALISFAALYAMIAAPIGWVSDALEDVGKFFASMGNWFSGNGWCSGEKCQQNAEAEYYDKLTAAVEKYSGQCKINEDLITATIFYGQMTKEEEMEYDNQEKSDTDNYFNYLDVKEGTGAPNATSQINKLIRVYLKGEKVDLDSAEVGELEITDDMTCSASATAYRDYLIDTYIDWAYKSATETKTKEEIADEILLMGNINIGGDDKTGGIILVGAGKAGAIPTEILDNCVNPLASQPMSHTSCFGYYSPSTCSTHNGIDIGSSLAEPILYSIADGEVVTVRRSNVNCYPNFNKEPKCGGCPATDGNRVSIKHTIVVDGKNYVFYSEYMHLKSISVSLGQKVSKGEKIGIMGNTGCSTGKHLHFNMLDSSKKRYNPEELLQYLNLPMRNDCEKARKVCSAK